MKKGVPVSPGVAVARAYCVDEVLAPWQSQPVRDGDVNAEINRFTRACAAAAQELDAIVARVGKEVGDEEASIFRSHRLLLRDPALIQKVRSTILNHHVDARTALQETLHEYTSLFSKIEDDYLRERMADIRDVLGRVAAQLALQDGHSAINLEEP